MYTAYQDHKPLSSQILCVISIPARTWIYDLIRGKYNVAVTLVSPMSGTA